MFCLIVPCFVLFGCYLLEAFSFLERKWTGRESWGEGRWEGLGGEEGGETGQDVLYGRRIYGKSMGRIYGKCRVSLKLKNPPPSLVHKLPEAFQSILHFLEQ